MKIENKKVAKIESCQKMKNTQREEKSNKSNGSTASHEPNTFVLQI
jgi:hypothetical protein